MSHESCPHPPAWRTRRPRLRGRPGAAIKANQVLIRVRACAINHLDLFVRAGIPGLKFPMPHVLGSDIAGEVVEVGELCERVKPGWRVLLSPGTSCRQCEQCLLGQDNLCRRFTMFGYGIDGGNAELLAVPGVHRDPDPRRPAVRRSRRRAAGVPHGVAHADGAGQAPAGRGRAGAGGIERRRQAAIQIAKMFQCRVIATAGGEEKLARGARDSARTTRSTTTRRTSRPRSKRSPRNGESTS